MHGVALVTIEEARGVWTAILWGPGLERLCHGTGTSAQSAMQNAVACRKRPQN